jgi:ribonucleoside-triphosphate reductase
MIGNCVVVGGVRRAATISLSDLSDGNMRGAKSGEWWKATPFRSIANNSAVYHDKQPPQQIYQSEWDSLQASKSGERGIFSRYAAKQVINRSNSFRRNFMHTSKENNIRTRDPGFDFGCNPCSEVLLRPDEFCNLTEIVVRASDTMYTLANKASVASILGTFQSTLTNFRFLGSRWKDNTADERLLGVSMTGIMDNYLTSGQAGVEKLKECLTTMRMAVISTNYAMATKMGVPSSVASTSVKPSGTVSSLVDSASGIHARHAQYYIRTARTDKMDPLAQLMIDQGCPYEEDVMFPSNYVFSFPIKAPDNALLRANMDAIQHLQIRKVYQMYWTDHKPSITVSIKDDEWNQVGKWVYDNFEWVSGISFLPYADHTYKQAPFQECDEEIYKIAANKMPNLDWSLLSQYEKSDLTTGSQELACSVSCEI